jgi:hypothetical protein
VHRQAFFTKDVRKPFSYEALLKYALQFADALRYMHDEAMPGAGVRTYVCMCMCVCAHMYVHVNLWCVLRPRPAVLWVELGAAARGEC